VFAPTDEAFAKLPAGTLESLLRPENKAKLQRILTYHVVPGKVMASDVVKLRSAKAVSGDALTIAARNGGVTVDNARVVKTDIATSNGVIHVIDAVILPKGERRDLDTRGVGGAARGGPGPRASTGAGADRRPGRSGSLCGRLVRNRALAEPLPADVHRRRARELRAAAQRQAVLHWAYDSRRI
jgi:hypothetical protein